VRFEAHILVAAEVARHLGVEVDAARCRRSRRAPSAPRLEPAARTATAPGLERLLDEFSDCMILALLAAALRSGVPGDVRAQ